MPWTRCVVMSSLLSLLAVVQPAALDSATRSAFVLQWSGAIGPATADYLARGLREAAARNAALVILEIDTPGGLDTSMRAMIRDVLGAAIPVITYVHPGGARAASAGTYLLYASHVAAMTPGTNLGAATPVSLGSPSPLARDEEDEATDDASTREGTAREKRETTQGGSALERKAINDAVAYLRALADLRGRNAAWAERAVREAASLSAREALQAGVIDIVARDRADLLRQAHGRRIRTAAGEVTLDTQDLTLHEMAPDWRAQLLSTISNPNLALIFMMIGVYGLIFEFMNPGALYPGTIGGICLLLGLYSLAALPLNAAGVAFMVLGLVLMIAEAFAPAFGVLGIGGAFAFAIGATMLMDTAVPGFELLPGVIAGVTLASLALSLVVLRLAYKASRRAVRGGASGMLGLRGEVIDWNATSGHVFVHGERWHACSPDALAPGSAVRVVGTEGLTLTVLADPEPDPTLGG